MSPVFDKSALYRRWLHLPAIAVIALAGASVAIAYKGIDAWRARFVPTQEHEPVTTVLVGRAELPHVLPDRVKWTVSLSTPLLKKDEAARTLADATHQAVDKLLAAGVPRTDLFVDEASIDWPASDPADGIYGGLVETRRASSPTKLYTGSRVIAIRSVHVGASIDAYQTVSLDLSPTMDVTPPTCWREDKGELQRQAQEAAWADLNRQANFLRAGHAALGRVVGVEPSDVDLTSNGEPFTCDADQSARATVQVTYELR